MAILEDIKRFICKKVVHRRDCGKYNSKTTQDHNTIRLTKYNKNNALNKSEGLKM